MASAPGRHAWHIPRGEPPMADPLCGPGCPAGCRASKAGGQRGRLRPAPCALHKPTAAKGEPIMWRRAPRAPGGAGAESVMRGRGGEQRGSPPAGPQGAWLRRLPRPPSCWLRRTACRVQARHCCVGQQSCTGACSAGAGWPGGAGRLLWRLLGDALLGQARRAVRGPAIQLGRPRQAAVGPLQRAHAADD